MRHRSKWLALALALVLTLALTVQAFALTVTWDMLKNGYDYKGTHYSGNAVLFDEKVYTPESVAKAVAAFQRYWDADDSKAADIYNKEFKPAILGLEFKAHTFTDAPTNWYDKALNFVCSTGKMDGVAEGKFDPQGTLNRAMAVTILWRMNGEPAPKADSGFADIHPNDWYADAVAWAVENKITDGKTDTTFDPLGNVTRQQMASFFSRMMQALAGMSGLNLTEAQLRAALKSIYNDVGLIDAYALEHVLICYEAKVMTGSGVKLFDPLSPITRAQGAQMLMNYYYFLLDATFRKF